LYLASAGGCCGRNVEDFIGERQTADWRSEFDWAAVTALKLPQVRVAKMRTGEGRVRHRLGSVFQEFTLARSGDANLRIAELQIVYRPA
jgi:hypothetical protein